MNQRFLMWGLASITFVVTLGITSWNDGLWPSDETMPTRAHNVRTASFTSDDSTDLPLRPFAPTHAAPPAPPVEKIAAVTPPPPPPVEPAPEEAAPPPTEEPSTQVSAQELDEADFQAQRSRDSERSARAR